MRLPIPLLRGAEHRDLDLYWWGQTTSAFGSVFTAIALPVAAVLRFHASPGEVGLLSAASVLPSLLFALPAGELADRIARPRRTLILLDTVSALVVAGVALGMAAHVAALGWLIALCAAQGCVSILIGVIYFIHLRQLAGPGQVGPARARLQAGAYGAGFVGRLLAGPVIVAFGVATAMCVDATSYLLSAAALLSMKHVVPVEVERGKSLLATVRGLGAGVRMFVSSPFHRALLGFILIPATAGAGISALTAPFLLDVVHIPTSVYGLAFVLSGVMGLIGSSVAVKVLSPRRDPRRVTILCFSATLACQLLLPLAGGPTALALACAALGLGLPIFFGALANVGLSPIIVNDADEQTVGRTVAALQVFSAGAALLGALLGGGLGDWLGPRAALWTIAGGGEVWVLLMLLPALRAARREAHGEQAETAAEPSVEQATQEPAHAE
ncbi:MFS transporter [Actinospica durhamensis]|uniref:MFS transporter n=1 Tax=Actinospica durhamensis TaxID=1508375 RepID=A0A941ITV1_9ACTN|nr:MFS transporter [Actinospica durhamensis]MBR7838137.1 MFS transporter [Actinospica durhamensis]